MARKSNPPEPPSGPPLTHGRVTAVVGIGASAGGLEAFDELLRNLPTGTGMAYIFVQHLDPRHHSQLSELLGRATPLRVQDATQSMLIEPDHVYVIRPGTVLSVRGGALQVTPRPDSGLQMPVDFFFRSIAEEFGGNSIGVVLSGSASDGTLGLKAIKAEGGITFAQKPETASFDGMPRSAIAAGCVDFVLSPSAIAQELVRISRHPYVTRPAEQQETASTQELERDLSEIFNMLRNASGVDFSFYKHGTIRRRIFRRMALLKLESTSDYVRQVRDDRTELDALFQDILINVTSFFREPPTFETLVSRIYPALLQNRAPDDTLRVWVPGCSTGEDVYSVAITLLEYLYDRSLSIPVQIFGTDLSEAALEKARAGIYPDAIASEVSGDRLRRFFTRVNASYQISRFVRDMCVFARQNLTKDPPFSRLDLVVCRNLLIYLGPVLQKKVMKLFHYALKPTGYLVLGISETVGSATDLFEPIDRTQKIYTRKAAQSTPAVDFENHDERARPMPHARPPQVAGPDLQKRMDQALLTRFVPPAVLVNRDLRIIHFRGQTSPYLEHASGEASLHLLKMARGGLGLEVRTLVQKAEREPGRTQQSTVAMPADGGMRQVRITVSPVEGEGEGARQFLVVFEDHVDPPRQPDPAPGGKQARKQPSGQKVEELERELFATRQYLQSVIEEQEAVTEELKSANEEIQSSNEELQSTNEELLTAKEELQSTNEELTTVNDEMQGRNEELMRTNNDLINLLSSVNIPIVMLGSDLRVRRFTPQAERMLNLLPSDVGRPIGDFQLKINITDLEKLVREVIDSLTTKEREVHDREGRVYSMWIRPYRTADNKIDGAVFALFDMTERREAAEARFRRIFETAHDGIMIAEIPSGEMLDVNPAGCKLLGTARGELIGRKITEIAPLQQSGIRLPLLAQLREDETIRRGIRVMIDSEWCEIELLGHVYKERDRRVIQLNFRDVTGRNQADERARGADDVSRELHSLKAVGRVAAAVSHEFGNQLTAILVYGDLLRGRKLAEADTADLMEIRAAAERAAAIDRQLLALGRKQRSRPQFVQLNSFIGEMQHLIAVILGDRYEIVQSIAEDVRPIRADEGILEETLLHVLLNARRAMPEGGQIRLETASVEVDEEFSKRHPSVPPGSYTTLTLTDVGTRPVSDVRQGLMEGIYTQRKGDAGAVGLAAVYNLVAALGGYVWAISELGVGSTVRLFFPAVQAQPSTGPQPRTGMPRGSERILLVEPDDAVRRACKRVLESCGYAVLEAAGAVKATAVAADHDSGIDLLATEVLMAGTPGPELAAAIAERYPGIKVLYTSGDPDSVLSSYGALEDDTALLRKPFSGEELAVQVREVLDRGVSGKSRTA